MSKNKDSQITTPSRLGNLEKDSMDITVDALINIINAGNIIKPFEDFLFEGIFEGPHKDLRDELFRRREEVKIPNEVFEVFVAFCIGERADELVKKEEEDRFVFHYDKLCKEYGIDAGADEENG